jgi:hypothetical protein
MNDWDKPEFFETTDALMRFREIKRRVMEADARDWFQDPPWATERPGRLVEKDGRPIQVNVQVSMSRGHPNGM